jgi:hypothetical protein
MRGGFLTGNTGGDFGFSLNPTPNVSIDSSTPIMRIIPDPDTLRNQAGKALYDEFNREIKKWKQFLKSQKCCPLPSQAQSPQVLTNPPVAAPLVGGKYGNLNFQLTGFNAVLR